MHIKSILTTAAIALVAGLGSASAGERFATIEGLPIQALSADELAEVRGADNWVQILANNNVRFFLFLMSDAVSNRICGADDCLVFRGRPVPIS
ncbi:MAG: hypothetical protein ACU0B1_02860 [Thermohalobaculum sp.]